MQNISAVFIGCANISAACLEELLLQDSIQVKAVFTADEQTARTAQITDLGQFDALAEKSGVELIKISPEKINDRGYVEKIRSISPDVLFCIGWPVLLGKEILKIPKYKIGMHPSKLPENRGQAPIPWAILRGLTASAVTCFKLVEKADAGQIYAQKEFSILPDDTSTTVYQKHYMPLGRQIITGLIPRILSGNLRGTPQDENMATWTRKRIPSDGFIDWTQSTANIYAMVRALTHPYYPGAFTYISDTLAELKIWKATPFAPANKYFGVPGQIVGIKDGFPIARTGDGCLLVQEVGAAEEIIDARHLGLKINQRLGINQADLISLLLKQKK
ncbi:MAG TPA: methionyl-tRNA formyltransferase [Nanoarchaeota archaeon]|nr:methionyl-tRNA formyltransferase [Nanoarchaeota archaeon]